MVGGLMMVAGDYKPVVTRNDLAAPLIMSLTFLLMSKVNQRRRNGGACANKFGGWIKPVGCHGMHRNADEIEAGYIQCKLKHSAHNRAVDIFDGLGVPDQMLQFYNGGRV